MAKPMLAYMPYIQVFNTDGTVLNGGTINYYAPTTTTPLTVYPSSADAIAGTNGFSVATTNSAGRPCVSGTPVDIYVTQAYKIVIKDSTGATIATEDNITTLGQLVSTVAKSANYAVVANDRDKVFLVNSTGGSVTLTLLSAASAGNGFTVAFKKMVSANTVTIQANGAETIDGSNTLAMTTQYTYKSIVCDGTQWIIK